MMKKPGSVSFPRSTKLPIAWWKLDIRQSRSVFWTKLASRAATMNRCAPPSHPQRPPTTSCLDAAGRLHPDALVELVNTVKNAYFARARGNTAISF